jgi:hypothetical protein
VTDHLELLKSKLPQRCTLLFSKVWGSHSHGTNLPGSDVDYTGVYAADERSLLSLHPPPETLTGEKPDYQIHEAKKFADLLLKGNPAIIEMLFTDRMCWKSPRWSSLVAVRDNFLTANVVKQYLGYSLGQLNKLRHGKSVHSKGGVPGEKWCYHMVRVAWDAERISKGQPPVVWKEGAELEKLMAIRTGLWTTEQCVREAEETIARIDAAKPWPIPESPDECVLELWLLGVRGL